MNAEEDGWVDTDDKINSDETEKEDRPEEGTQRESSPDVGSRSRSSQCCTTRMWSREDRVVGNSMTLPWFCLSFLLVSFLSFVPMIVVRNIAGLPDVALVVQGICHVLTLMSCHAYSSTWQARGAGVAASPLRDPYYTRKIHQTGLIL